MKKKIFFIVLTVIIVATLATSVTARQDQKYYIPYVRGPVVTCDTANPLGDENHVPYGMWYPKEQQYWRTIVIWFPGAGQYQAEHKLLLRPGEVIGLVNGGGHDWWYCSENAANSNFGRMNLPEVKLETLLSKGLAVKGQITTTPVPTATITVTPTSTITPSPTSSPCVPTSELKTLSGPAGYGYWSIEGGSEAVVNIWTNMPGRTSALRKLRLKSSDGAIYILGGGDVTYWPSGCVAQADEAYVNNSNQAVTLATLQSEKLVFNPAVCNNPQDLNRTPVKDVAWTLGGPDNIVVGLPFWSNQTTDQAEFRSILYPFTSPWPVLVGGHARVYSAGCGVEAEEYLNSSQLPLCNQQCLADKGFFAWP